MKIIYEIKDAKFLTESDVSAMYDSIFPGEHDKKGVVLIEYPK